MYIYQQTKDIKIKILIETSSGQGSEIGYKLEDLAYIYRKFSKHDNKDIVDRFGICIDTCHIFAAGYKICNKESREIFFDNLNELIGLEHIKLVHLNDSKSAYSSHVDRHENIGKGHIGKEAILIIATIFKNLDIPIILETPFKHIYDDLQMLINIHSYLS